MGEKVLLFEPDLLFSSRIESVASRFQLEVKVTVTAEELRRAVQESVPKVLLVDLDALPGSVSLSELVDGRCKVVGYYSHADSKLAARASANGFEMVIPRRSFMEQLNKVLAEIASG